MKVILDPMPHDYLNTAVSVSGLMVTVDGVDYDLSIIPMGGQAEAAEDSPFVGIVTRDLVRVRYCYDINKAESIQSTDWNDYTFEIESGEVPCPIKWLPETDIEEPLVEDNDNDV